MILEYINADNTRDRVELHSHTAVTPEWIHIDASNKLDFLKRFIPAFASGQKIILFDARHKQLADFHDQNKIEDFEGIQEVDKRCQLLLFTSGSSGFPVGAFKSKENLLSEVEVQAGLFGSAKRVVVTVPFIHIYGILAGILLPLQLDGVTLVVKEDFLPYELLAEAVIPGTLVVTTPVFIKALLKLPQAQDLSQSAFISSTAPLPPEDAAMFEQKYSTTLTQLFGSTETGGIAYKKGGATEWTTMPKVHISSQDERLSVTSPFLSPYVLNKTIMPLQQPFQTEDIVEMTPSGFALIGRSNKIVKIAGKRISVAQLEMILESIEGVQKAIVEVTYQKELSKSEQLLLTLQAVKTIERSVIKAKMSEFYGVLSIPFCVKYVDTITYSAVGKKVIF
jgi:acyl-coenzyme A synthetase/AMP-(fatty) acid ligase